MLYEAFTLKSDAVKKTGKYTTTVDIAEIFNKMTKTVKGQLINRYKTTPEDYLEELLSGKYVSYRCETCNEMHEGVVEDIILDSDENLARVQIILDWMPEESKFDHMANVWDTPVTIHEIGKTTMKFGL